jgi:hypothetical protein
VNLSLGRESYEVQANHTRKIPSGFEMKGHDEKSRINAGNCFAGRTGGTIVLLVRTERKTEWVCTDFIDG